jgi:hypothetical protein
MQDAFLGRDIEGNPWNKVSATEFYRQKDEAGYATRGDPSVAVTL